MSGYVLDSIFTTTRASADNFAYFSHGEINFGGVGDHVLDLCAEDNNCHPHFATKSLPETLEDLLVQFDMNPNSTCATLVFNKASNRKATPSFKFRRTLGSLLDDEGGVR